MSCYIYTDKINDSQPCATTPWDSTLTSLTLVEGQVPYSIHTYSSSFEITPACTGDFHIQTYVDEQINEILDIITIYQHINSSNYEIVMTYEETSTYMQRSGDIANGYVEVGFLLDDDSELGAAFILWQNSDKDRNTILTTVASNEIYKAVKNADSTKPYVLLKWSDPPNITDWEPTPCNWEGTVVIRKEDSPPMHRWDGIKIVGNKRRDKYKTEGYKDEDIKMGMTYYYGFFPYYTADDSDPNHPLRYYRFTKVIKVETGDNSLAPVINSITVDGNSATINYSLSEPDGSSFASVKLYGKIGSNPVCDNTDDIIEDVDPTLTSITCTGLNYETTYYFAIVTTSENDEELTSNVMSCNITIPAEYQVYLDLINGCNGEGLDFFWKDYTVTGASRLTAIDNPANFSYVRPTGNWSGDEVIVVSANTSNTLVASSIITLNINKQQNNTYKVLVTGYDIAIDQNRYAYSFQYSHYTAKDGSLVASSDYVNQYVLDNYWKMGIFDYDFSTLEGALQFLTKNVRNCNIYVDGVLWSKANNTN